MSVLDTFAELTLKMNSESSHLQGITYVYQFDLEDTGTYQLKVENNEVKYCQGEEWEPRLTLEMSEENFVKLAHDELNPTMAYMSGKLKIRGDLSHALKFHSLIKKYQ